MKLSKSSISERVTADRIRMQVMDLGYPVHRDSWMLEMNGLTHAQMCRVWRHAWAQIPESGYVMVELETKGFVRKSVRMSARLIRQARVALYGLRQCHDSGALNKRAYKPTSCVPTEQPEDRTPEDLEQTFFAEIAPRLHRSLGIFSAGNQSDAWKLIRDYATDWLLGHRPDLGAHHRDDAKSRHTNFHHGGGQ